MSKLNFHLEIILLRNQFEGNNWTMRAFLLESDCRKFKRELIKNLKRKIFELFKEIKKGAGGKKLIRLY